MCSSMAIIIALFEVLDLYYYTTTRCLSHLFLSEVVSEYNYSVGPRSLSARSRYVNS